MATGLVATRSRVTERVNRVSMNLDRSSGYLLGNLNATPTSATLRRTRDSSIGTLGRSNIDSGVRYRDSSLTRGGRIGAGESVRHSMVLPPTSETSKYTRELQIKDIHNSFMKTYKETNNKLSGKEEESDRKSKAYQKIVNNAPPSYMDETMAKKQALSEMFMDTSKFSTKTLSAINGLEGAVIRKNKDYNWRKEMEEYEKRTEFERDVRARNVTALHRNAPSKDEDDLKSRKRTTNTVIEKPTEKAAKQDAVQSWREKREANRKAAEAEQAEPQSKSWREKLAEKQKEEEEKQIADKKAAEAAAKTAAEARKAAEEASDQQAESAEKPAENAEEEEDLDGSKKLKKDFDFMMSGLDEEMEAGRSKLSKLRERMRNMKKKHAEAAAAQAEEDKAQDAKREALREQMRKKAQEKKNQK